MKLRVNIAGFGELNNMYDETTLAWPKGFAPFIENPLNRGVIYWLVRMAIRSLATAGFHDLQKFLLRGRIWSAMEKVSTHPVGFLHWISDNERTRAPLHWRRLMR